MIYIDWEKKNIKVTHNILQLGQYIQAFFFFLGHISIQVRINTLTSSVYISLILEQFLVLV